MAWHQETNPFSLFATWFEEATLTESSDAGAMALATIDPDGRPSVRIVLLKKWDPTRGFIFCTNGHSRKSKALQQKPIAALVLYWKHTYRQIRIEGGVRQTSQEEAAEIFAARHRENQLATWSSQQSAPLASFAHFTQALEANRTRFADEDQIPCPPFWIGYQLCPTSFEFWQGHPHRIHQRVCFTRTTQDVPWEKTFLYP